MAQIPTGQKTIAQINTEVSSVNSNSLNTLSTSANSYTGGNSTVVANNVGVEPHSMDEFSGYTHGPPTHNIGWSWSGPSGKMSFYQGIVTTGSSVPFGSYNINYLRFRDANQNGPFWIYWTSGRNDSWTSLTIGTSTWYRSGASNTTSTTHEFDLQTSTQRSNILNNTSGYFTY